MTIKIRTAEPEDGAEISTIAAASVGAGAFGIRVRLHGDAYTVFTRHPMTEGIVACTEGDHVVGYVFYRPLTILLNGEPVRSIFGFNQAVHPDYRRQGIGRRLTLALFEAAADLGAHVSFGGTGGGNIASRGNLSKVDCMDAGMYVRAIALTRKRSSRLPAGVRIRRAEASDLAAWAAAANDFYREHNFWQPLSAELLQEWVSPIQKGLKRGLYLIEDAEGRLLAGIGSDDCSRLFTWVIERAPWPVRMAGRLLRLLDNERRVRTIRVMAPWYRDGEAAVARSLWQWLRWCLRDDASLIIAHCDPRSPAKEATIRPFYLPTTECYRYACTNIDIDTDRAVVSDVF